MPADGPEASPESAPESRPSTTLRSSEFKAPSSPSTLDASETPDPEADRGSGVPIAWAVQDLERIVDEICDRFELQWNSSNAPRIENWLAGAVGPLRERLTRELILTDVELRRRNGGVVSASPYESIFDQFPDWLLGAVNPARCDASATLTGVSGEGVSGSGGIDQSGIELPVEPSANNRTGVEDGDAGGRMDPLVGAQLGNYLIVRRIARGGMGVVYEALDGKLDRTVALKTIVGGALASPEAIRRFQAEAQAAGRIEHPGIVPIHDVSAQNELPYYVMGLVDGESLQHRLERQPFPIMEAVVMVERIARAVAHAHRGGVVHRDLKPANVLIDKDGQPRITDFGLAKRMDSDVNLTLAGQVMGTPGYMAPEQAAGKTDVGEAADIYSVGAILYALFTGEPPFFAKNYMETLQLVQNETPKSPRESRRDIPRDLETVCMTCLAKIPGARYDSAEALADDLRRVINSERVLARPWSVWTRLGLWIRRRPALAVTFLALLPLYAWHLFRWLNESPYWTVRNHSVVTTIVGVWLLVSSLLQSRLLQAKNRDRVLFGWAAFELIMLTIFLGYFDGPSSGYVIGYLLLVVAAALRQSIPLVGLVTLGSLVCYTGLLVEASLHRPEKLPDPIDHTVMLFVSLLVIGLSQWLMLRRSASSAPS
jgi:serine/threonine protein kinase